MNSKLYSFIILFIFNHFQLIWQHHVPVNEIHMFSVKNRSGCIVLFRDTYIVDDNN